MRPWFGILPWALYQDRLQVIASRIQVLTLGPGGSSQTIPSVYVLRRTSP